MFVWYMYGLCYIVVLNYIFYLDNLTNPLLDIIDGIILIKQDWARVSRMNEFFTKKSHVKDAGSLTQLEETTIEFENVTLMGVKKKKILEKQSSLT